MMNGLADQANGLGERYTANSGTRRAAAQRSRWMTSRLVGLVVGAKTAAPHCSWEIGERCSSPELLVFSLRTPLMWYGIRTVLHCLRAASRCCRSGAHSANIWVKKIGSVSSEKFSQPRRARRRARAASFPLMHAKHRDLVI